MDKTKLYKKKTEHVTKIDSYTVEQVLDAIKNSGGIILTISKKLKCSRRTVERLIDMHEETKTAYEDEKNSLIDEAKITIKKAIKDGDTSSAKWYLSKKAKDEGFGDEPIVTVNNQSVASDTTIKSMLDKMTQEEKDFYFSMCEKYGENATNS